MSTHKYISFDKSTKSWVVKIPTTIARKHKRSNKVGKRRDLDAALLLRNKVFGELGILALIEDVQEDVVTPTFLADGDKATAFCKGPRVRTVEDLIAHCEIDTNIWEVEKPTINCWDMTNRDGQTYQNFQVKATFKRRFCEIDFDYLSGLLKNHIKERAKPINKEFDYGDGDHLMEINIADLHFGRLCWRGETGEDFDMKIARDRFLTALTRLISLSYSFRLEKILFVIGNDFFQSDNLIGETSAGTRQDMDGRYGKMYSEGVALIIEAIDILRAIAPVDVVSVAGNHEKQSGMCAAHCVNLYYSNIDEVEVDWQPIFRKYRQYGDTMVALAHGHGVKKNDWFEVIASESAKMWGETKFRYLHLGHFHHSRIEEHKGLTIQYLGSLTGVDNWHAESGYVQTRKSASAFVYSRSTGMVSELVCNLPVDTKVNMSTL